MYITFSSYECLLIRRENQKKNPTPNQKSAQQALITTLSISILIFLLILLFGAPTTSYVFPISTVPTSYCSSSPSSPPPSPTRHLLHSLTLSLHLSFLLAYPLFNALGVPSIYEKGIYDRFRLSRLLCEVE